MGAEGKIAVVTGGARGIGAGIVRRLAADGYRVAVLDLDLDLAQRIAEEVGGAAHRCDVGDPDEVRRVAAEVGPAEVLVNNAAIVGLLKTVMQCTDDDLAANVRVNLLGAVHCCRAFGRMMIERGGGSIVSISSGAARSASPGHGIYPATKAAIETLTRQLALEWGPLGVRVNAVAPGAIQTERNAHRFQGEIWEERVARIPLGRTGFPADIADVVAALCSHDMRYVTGQIIAVDGGMSAGSGGG
jgi:NAD(P)-dependent dehydrogenase (short-subunit alcohol dehydrogenase family)